MLKSDRQLMLEARNGNRDIKDIIQEALGRHQGERHLVLKVAVELGISDQTLCNWCRDLDIDLDDYRN